MSSGIIMRNGIQYGNAVLNKADEILTDDNKTVQDELNTLKTSLNKQTVYNKTLSNINITIAYGQIFRSNVQTVTLPRTYKNVKHISITSLGSVMILNATESYGVDINTVNFMFASGTQETNRTLDVSIFIVEGE